MLRAGAGSQWLYLTTCTLREATLVPQGAILSISQTLLKVLPLTTGTQLGGTKHWQSPQRLASSAHCGQDDVSYLLQPGQTSLDTRTFQCLQQAPRFPLEINTFTNQFTTFLLRNSTLPEGEFFLGQSCWRSQPSLPSWNIGITLSILFSWMNWSVINSVPYHFELESWRERTVDNSRWCSWSSVRALSNFLKVSESKFVWMVPDQEAKIWYIYLWNPDI